MYSGKVIEYRPAGNADDDEDLWAIEYQDGDQEEFTLVQLRKHLVGSGVAAAGGAETIVVSDFSADEEE